MRLLVAGHLQHSSASLWVAQRIPAGVHTMMHALHSKLGNHLSDQLQSDTPTPSGSMTQRLRGQMRYRGLAHLFAISRGAVITARCLGVHCTSGRSGAPQLAWIAS